MDSDRVAFGFPPQEFTADGQHTERYRARIRALIRMARFTAQAAQVLLNQDGKVAQVSFQGLVSLAKSQASMAFIWTPADPERAALQGIVDKALEQIKADEGLEP